MESDIRIDAAKFWDQGYLLIRDVFSSGEIEEFRRRGFENRQRHGELQIDLLADRILRKAILDDRILSIASQILGDTPVYYGDSGFNIGQHTVGFHRDNVDRDDGDGPDWQSKYTQIRFGIYLQDHAWHAGGLRLVPQSHNAISNPGRKRKNVRTRVGDLAVWSLRTSHAGAASMLRLLPWIYVELPDVEPLTDRIYRRIRGMLTGLSAEPSRNARWGPGYMLPSHPAIRVRVPRFLVAEGGAERAAIFFTLGLADAHMERYISYLKTCRYAIEGWKSAEYGPDVWDAVRGKNIKVIDVGEEVRSQLAAGDTSLGVNKQHVPIPY
jgi:hypothetical protein